MFEDNETGENIQWNAKVVELDPDSDPVTLNFLSRMMKMGKQEKQEYYLVPLLGDYLDHCVQMVSLDLDVQTNE